MRVVHIIPFQTVGRFVSIATVLTFLLVVPAAHGQDIHRPEYQVNRSQFEASFSGGIAQASNRLQSFEYGTVTFRGAIQAGSASFAPADSPSLRIDSNTVGSPFAGVGSLKIVHDTLGTFICSGTVITPTHVLTAAHCFDLEVPDDGMVDTDINFTMSKFNLNAGSPLVLGISSVTIHPDFGGFVTTGANDDLAIVKLSTRVPASTPKYAIRGTAMPSGDLLELVGYGRSGFGDMGFSVSPNFTDKRSGKNEGDLFLVDDEGGGFNEIFLFDFDSPVGYDPPGDSLDDPNFLGGTTLGNTIETTVGGGDSGGPAFVEIGGELVIGGINTFQLAIGGITPPAGFFGSLGGGIEIGPYTDWIVSVAPEVSVIPEPTSLALLLPAILVFGGLRRSRRAKSVA